MNDYYCAFDNKWSTNPAIGYGNWKIFNKDLLYRIKKMTDEEVKDLCGVKPDMFIEDDELMESMKDWGKQTYAKDEGEVPFTLEGLQKLWEVIEKEKKNKLIAWDYGIEGNDYTCKVYGCIDKNSNWHIEKVTRRKNIKKEKRMYDLMKEKAFKLTTEEFKKWWLSESVQKRVKKFLKYREEKRERMRMLILKNVKTGKHYQVPINSRYSFQTTKDPKIGDIVFKVDREDVSKVNECRVVKILEYDKDRKKRDRPVHLILENMYTKMKIHYVTPYREGRNYKVGDDIHYNYQHWKVFKIIQPKEKEKLDPFIEKRRPKGGIRKPKGVVFSEFAYNMPFNWVTPDYMKKLFKGLEKPNMVLSYHRHAGKNTAYYIIKKEEARRKLSEFHKRPYLKVVLEEVKGKPRGEENIRKIIFPCYCSYVCNGKEWVGQLNRDWDYYYLDSLNSQKEYNSVGKHPILKILMDKYEVEILKGEVKVWKEVGEYTK